MNEKIFQRVKKGLYLNKKTGEYHIRLQHGGKNYGVNWPFKGS